jgi:uncharacterized protein
MVTTLNPFASSAKTVTEISQLCIYLIKPCRGIQIKKSFLKKRGLDLDRRWMFVDGSTNKFITIRGISELTLKDTAFASATDTGSEDDVFLVIRIRNTDKKVMVPARPMEQWLKENTTLAQVGIWEYDTDDYVYKDEINDVFTDFFKKPVKLVYKGPTP